MKKFTLFILIAVVAVATLVSKEESEAGLFLSKISARAILIVDYESGEILYEESSDLALAVAGMSKLMTEYIVLNAIDGKRIFWKDLYTPSRYALFITDQPSITNIGMKEGERYTVKELFEAMTILSANDAAVALTEMISGTEENFVTLMNEHADYFGLNKTIYYNASGLDGSTIGKGIEETNISSAQDVAFLARKLISRHPQILYFTKRRELRTSTGKLRRTPNLMLRGMPNAMQGIDGLKTGFTDEAGPCFVGTGVFGGRRIVTVVIDVETVGGNTINPRFELTKALIERFVY